MIQADELRLGNWLTNFLNEPFQVNAETIAMLSTPSHPGKEFSYPQPISLTPALLLNAGFEQQGEYELTVKLGHKYFLLYNSGQRRIYSTVLGTDIKILHESIKCIHQLQNLYFALTGNELQIEL